MMVRMKVSACTAAMLLLLACSAPAQQTQQPLQDTDVAARVGDRAITLKEIDDRWRSSSPAEHAQAVQQIYDGRKEALDAIIADMLIEQAAKAKSLNPTQYTEAEIARRIKPLTDVDVVAFFQQNQSQMQGRGFAAMEAPIRRFLEQQRRTAAYQELVAELRKAGPDVRMVLDAPRYPVDVRPDDPYLGGANAPVTLVEFSDFQCPFCLRVAPTLKELHKTYGDRIRIVWKDFPLTAIHPDAFKAAEAANCAREQGKFWEYHDVLFANQEALDPGSLKDYAANLKLDTATFNQCLDTAKYNERVQDALKMGNGLGVQSTPSTFVNGRLVSGAVPLETFTRIIDEELERARTK
jgi:protein-disulfide isomerase